MVNSGSTGRGFQNVVAAHHGQIHVPPGDITSRRFELIGDFSEANIRYRDDWPTLNEATGSLHVAGRHTYAELSQGETGGSLVGGAEIHVDANQGLSFLRIASNLQAASILSLIRNSPLQAVIAFRNAGMGCSG